MREYKFNAWDTKQKRMWTAEEMGKDQLTLSPDGRGFVNVSGVDAKRSQFYEHLIPLQWIGLSDKKGVEIHEGHIIMFPDVWSEPVGDAGTLSDECQYIAPIIFKGGCFGIKGCGDSRSLLFQYFYPFNDGDYCVEECEIIGNIYENPWLIS